jgi:hypothetical protein
MKRGLFILQLMLVAAALYAQDGTAVWTNRFNNSLGGRDSTANALVVDTNGNIFVTGASPNNGGDLDYVTLKYSNAGVALWTNRYNAPPGGNDDSANAMALDASGNVIVTGSSVKSDQDFATVKYSNAGAALWTNRYDSGFDDAAVAIATDTNGNVFVTGSSYNINFDSDYVTIKYSSAGVPLWTNRYDGGFSDDMPSALKVDANGNVFVTGFTTIDEDGDYAYGTIKYSNAGVPLWTNLCVGAPNASNTDQAYALALDTNGNVFVTGGLFNNFGNTDVGTVAYSNSGIPLWTNRYDGPTSAFDYGYAIAVDSSSNVFVTGLSQVAGANHGYITLKYSNAGVPLWTNRYDTAGYNAAFALAVDSNGNVIVGGEADFSGDPDDYVAIKYSGAGVALWTNSFNGGVGGGYGHDGITAMGVDASGDVFVTGDSLDLGLFAYVTIKYSGASPNAYLYIKNAVNGVVLTWTNTAFSLQSAPLVTGTYTNVMDATSPYTNPITDSHQFFRLIH